MPPLTWRNVDAPNFTPAIQAYSQAGDAINKAISGFQSGIDGFIDKRNEETNARALVNSLGYNDPEAFAKAMKDGLITGANPERITAETARALGDRQSQILDAAVKQQGLTEKTYTHDRTVERNKLFDAAGPAFLEAMPYAEKGDMATVMKKLGSHPLLSEMRGEDLMSLWKEYSEMATAGLGRQNTRANIGLTHANTDATRQQMDIADYGFKRNKLEDTREDETYERGETRRIDTEAGVKAAREATVHNPTDYEMDRIVGGMVEAGEPLAKIEAFISTVRAEGYNVANPISSSISAGSSGEGSGSASGSSEITDPIATAAAVRIAEASRGLPMVDPVAYNNAHKDTSNVSQVADRIIAQGGIAAGADKNDVMESLKYIMNQTGARASVAELIMSDAVLSAGWWPKFIDGIGNGMQVDRSPLNASISAYQKGDFADAAVAIGLGKTDQKRIDTAKRKVDSLTAELLALEEKQNADPESVSRVQERLDKALAAFNAVVTEIEGNPAYNLPDPDTAETEAQRLRQQARQAGRPTSEQGIRNMINRTETPMIDHFR